MNNEMTNIIVCNKLSSPLMKASSEVERMGED
jgi:hypothetical protein